MQILTKVIAVDTDAQVISGECYVVGAELNDSSGDDNIKLYNEDSSTKTASQLFVTLRACAEVPFVKIMFPMPGLKCDGVYVKHGDAGGVGTLYYYY